MNSFGDTWTFTSFGESHGLAVGGVLDGVPAGLHIDIALIRSELERRAGKVQSDNVQCTKGVSPRAMREPDEVEWLSGVMESDQVTKDQGTKYMGQSDDVQCTKYKGQSDNVQCTKYKGQSDNVQCTKYKGQSDKVQSDNVQCTKELVTLGTPIAFIIRNKDARPEDYAYLKHTYRTGHADRVYEQKYGIRDWRGGGRASARETAARVVAGCIAKQELAKKGISIHASLVQVGAETDPTKFGETIARYQADGDSIGGIVACRIAGLPVGTGEPIFDKLQAHLAYAILSINACKGFEYGTGFGGVTQPGSAINHISGGIAGGIADGTDVMFRCVFKPTPSTPKALMEVTKGQGTMYKGRHDACVATRAVPVVEAMTALALVNLI